jgi:hypothetical protein
MTTKELVLIEWEDSTQPQGSWSWLEQWDGPTPRVVRCRSVGWLVCDDEDVKVLAPNLGECGGDYQVSGVIRIPARSVVKIVRLPDADCALALLPAATWRRGRWQG